MADEHPGTGQPGNELDRQAPQQPPSPPAHQPTEAELEQFRQWQQFQQFQQFQAQQTQFQQGQFQQGQAGPLQPVHPAPPPAAGHDAGLRDELAGMRADLTELRASHARTERAVNPPLWRKILRSGWVRGIVGLIVVFLVAGWAINHYFGGNADSTHAAVPPPQGFSRPDVQQKEAFPNPKDAVATLYRDLGSAAASPDHTADYAKNGCLIFSDAAEQKFAAQHNAPTCAAVFGKLPITDPVSYQQASLQSLPQVPNGAQRTTIDSCQIDVSGGPKLGTFTLSTQTSGLWLITDVAPSHCG